MRYKRSLSTAKRLNEIVGMLIRYGFDELIEQEAAAKARQWILETFGQETDKETVQRSPAERGRLLLQELGPTFVKFGQMAASQSASLPEEWAEELAKLQSNVPPVEAELVEEVIQEELGGTSSEIFGSFDTEALAAASIGQVHAATLPDGTKVAVKIQRPNITDKIAEDLAIMHATALMLESTSDTIRDFGAANAVNEFATSLNEELSYRHEARNTTRLGKQLRDFPNIRTAHIYDDFSSDKVLAMEFIVGVKPTATNELAEAGIDTVALAKDFARCVAQQLLLDGFFHADPHPGNLSINLDTHEMIFLDTGMMGILDKSERHDLIQLMLAISQRDAPALAKTCLYMGTALKEVNRKALSHELERLMGNILDTPLGDIGGSKFFSTLLELLREHGIRLPSGMVMALKSLMQMLEVVVALHRDLTFSEISDIVANVVFTYHTQPDTWKQFGQDRIRRLQLLGPLVDDALEELLRQTQRGSLNVELRGLDLSKETKIFSTVGRHFTQALLLGGATIGSAIAMGASPKGTWSFVPAFAAVGFVLSIVLSIWLLVQDVRKDK